MSYSINNSKSEVINILKKSCNEDPIKNDLIDETVSNNLEIYGTNMLVDNNAQSVKNCEIRLDNSINMTNPINKSDDYEQILLDILMAEYIDKLGELDRETIKILKLSINIYNKASIVDKEEENKKYADSPVKNAIVSDKFLLKRIVRNSDESLNMKQSANESLKNLVTDLLDNTIPFKIAQTREDLQKLFKIIDSGESNIYNFYNNEGNVICISPSISEKKQLLEKILNSNLVNDYINLRLYKHKFTNIKLVNRDKFFYLTNIGDGDCLYIAIAKYLYILSAGNRDYPDNNSLRKTAEHIRLESSRFMYNNRFKLIDDRGTIEDLVGNSNIWNATLNNQIKRFSDALPTLAIEDLSNPTSMSFEKIKSEYNTLDDFTKYCIYMAQHNDNFSPYAGEIEILCISMIFNRNIFLLGNATDGTIEDGNKKLTHYKVIGGKSIVNTSNDLPIFLFLKDSHKSGSHYEILWPRKFGKPPTKQLNTVVDKAADDNSRWENNVNSLRFIKNDDPNHVNNMELPMIDLIDYYIDRASPMIIQLLPESIAKLDNTAADPLVTQDTPIDEQRFTTSEKADSTAETTDSATGTTDSPAETATQSTDKVITDIVRDTIITNTSIDKDVSDKLTTRTVEENLIDDVIEDLSESMETKTDKKVIIEDSTKTVENNLIEKYPLESYTKIGNYKYKNKYLFKANNKILNINGLNISLLKNKFKIDFARPINIVDNLGNIIIRNFNSKEDIELLNILLVEGIIIADNKIKIKKKKRKRRKKRNR